MNYVYTINQFFDTMKNLLLLSHLIFLSNFSFAQLNAEFTWCPEPDSSAQICCIRFENLSTDTGGTITSYFYIFGDGTESTLMQPLHCYSQLGTYIVYLFVTDNLGNVDTAIHSLTITHVDTAGCNCDSLIGINEAEAGFDDFNLTPNPIEDHATLTWSLNGISSRNFSKTDMIIYNAAGQAVRIDPIQLEEGKYNFERRDLQSGIYYFKIVSADKKLCGRGKFILK